MKSLLRYKWWLSPLVAFLLTGSHLVQAAKQADPNPPQLPKTFDWLGRYVVKDMNADVIFYWRSDGTNMQMTAGQSKADPIHFSNLIHNNRLYTVTYKWGNLIAPDDPVECSCVGAYTIDKLNACLAESRYVGPEILQNAPDRDVHHFRVSIPLVSQADFYVDKADPKSNKVWQVLHYGLQNLYDPALDEWIEILKHSSSPGTVKLPDECARIPADKLQQCDRTILTPLCK